MCLLLPSSWNGEEEDGQANKALGEDQSNQGRHPADAGRGLRTTEPHSFVWARKLSEEEMEKYALDLLTTPGRDEEWVFQEMVFRLYFAHGIVAARRLAHVVIKKVIDDLTTTTPKFRSGQTVWARDKFHRAFKEWGVGSYVRPAMNGGHWVEYFYEGTRNPMGVMGLFNEVKPNLDPGDPVLDRVTL